MDRGSGRQPKRIADYLFANTPPDAADLVFAIHNAPSVLLTFPYRGRQGKKQGTRELVLSSLPYVVVYQVSGDVIDVARILHGAQNGP